MSATRAEKAKGRRKPALSTLGSSQLSARDCRTPDGRTRDAGGRPTSAAELRAAAAEGAALGSSGDVIPAPAPHTASSVATYHRTLDRFRLRDRARTAWRIAGQLDNNDDFRTTRLCGLTVLDGVGGVELRRRLDGQMGADAVGTMSCSSANAVCPVCTARVREKRRREIAALVENGQTLGYQFVFVTATLRHTRDTGVAQQRAALEAGWKAITTGRAAQDRKRCGQVAGTVRAFEFMLEGPAGPHGHVHAIIAVAPNVTARGTIAAMTAMGDRWREYAQRNMDGLRPDDAHGWSWEVARNADDVTKYVVKLVDGESWDITHETTRGDAKVSRGTSITPLQLLDRAVTEFNETGDVRLMLRMAEYARAVKGMRSIVVSRSFREALGSDTDVADEEPVWETVAIVPIADWNRLTKHYGVAVLIDVAARLGTAGIADLIDKGGGCCRCTG